MGLLRKVLSGTAKSVLAGAFLFGSFGNANAGNIPKWLQDYSVKSKTEIVETERLRLNPEGDRIYFTPISCEKGYIQARELAQKRFIEEYWGCNKDFWVSFGKRGTSINKVIPRNDLVNGFMSNETDYKLPHIHPFGDAVPSKEDLKYFLWLSNQNFPSKISFPIISSKGVFDFSFTKPISQTQAFMSYNPLRNLYKSNPKKLAEELSKMGFMRASYKHFEE